MTAVWGRFTCSRTGLSRKEMVELRRMLWVLIASLVIVAAIAIGVFIKPPRAILDGLSSMYDDVIYYVPTHERVIALTIDDGPHPEVTPQILDVLRRYDAKATFFVLGERARGNEALLDDIRADGHELANHLLEDRPSIFLSMEEFEEELLMVDSLIQPTGRTKWFRPGSGVFSRQMLATAAKHGYRCVLASAYPMDTHVPSQALIERGLRLNIAPGNILILHDGTPKQMWTVRILDKVLPVFRERGYRFVTVSELLALRSGE